MNTIIAENQRKVRKLTHRFAKEQSTVRMIYDISVKTIEGETVSLEIYRGKVMLIVNVASLCSLTPQYAGLEKLYEQFRGEGLVVLGFPCNQFGYQEPGTEAEIQSFCSREYRVSFPLFAKIDVNGPNTHPLYSYLKTHRPGMFGIQRIVWNFTKFLVDRSGESIKRFGPTVPPDKLEKTIRQFLAKSPR